jgi:curved DNA-binding protein CbpA
MGNDSSKSVLENQQMIMQLQQQIASQQQMASQQQYRNQQTPTGPPTFRPHPQYPNQGQSQYVQSPSLPVLSPAELLQRAPDHPITQMRYDTSKPALNGQKNNLFDILKNKKLMQEIDQNPRTKRKLLEKMLSEHRHVMTAAQVSRITNILDSLPPLDNSYDTSFASLNTAYQGGRGGFNEGTTEQDPRSRQLQTTKQLNTIEALTQHYQTEAEAEEAAFKLEEERRRQEFADRQRRRKMDYQAKLTDLDKSNVDALKLFQLPKNYTLDQLKTAYKKLALKTHPDKAGGNQEQFQLVTKCYMSLLEKYKNRESDKPFNDLRAGSQEYLKKQSGRVGGGGKGDINAIMDGQVLQKDKFDVNLFNKIYEQNKLWESGDDGYGDWFKSGEGDEAPEVFGNKFNLNVFNSTFEDYKERISSQSGAIQEYKEPKELVSCSTGFTDLDIYARKVDDFSKPLPVGSSKKELPFTDLKTAYTAKGAFIDPNKVEYKTYKNVNELKKDRSNIRYDMTPEQMRDYEMKKRKEEEEEERRQELIRQRDNITASSYSRTHERMLGYKANPDY